MAREEVSISFPEKTIRELATELTIAFLEQTSIGAYGDTIDVAADKVCEIHQKFTDQIRQCLRQASKLEREEP